MTQVGHCRIWKYPSKTGDSVNAALVSVILWFSVLAAKRLEKVCIKEGLFGESHEALMNQRHSPSSVITEHQMFLVSWR